MIKYLNVKLEVMIKLILYRKRFKNKFIILIFIFLLFRILVLYEDSLCVCVVYYMYYVICILNVLIVVFFISVDFFLLSFIISKCL